MARDFSCCVLTKDAEFLAMAESLPIHLPEASGAKWTLSC
jgi:hypothetical protein